MTPENQEQDDSVKISYDCFYVFVGRRELDEVLAEYKQKLNEFVQKGWLLHSATDVAGILFVTVFKEEE